MTLVEEILGRLNIDALNPMQEAALAANEQAGDLVILAPTGSGKTLAFLLPLLPLLQQEGKGTRALVVVPSRELAQQIEKVFKSMGTGLKITSCYGGHKREIEENNLIESPGIIVGTPGRIADHLRRGNITEASIETLVLDEYDKSVELGFHDEMAEIVAALPGIKKRVLTSATISQAALPAYLKMQQVQTVDFLPPEDHVPPAEKLSFYQLLSPDADKVDTLYSLLCFAGNRSAIIFCNHRDAVERTSNMLSEKGIINTFYHGAMEQVDRDSALSKFRNGSVNFLVTTDLAARGLDIPNIRYIVHYHLPHTEDSFIHRNGRTARVEASGTVIVLVGPNEKIPAFIPTPLEDMELPNEIILPEKPKWVTFFIAAGKKDKVNKIDIVGFLSHKGKLKKEDIGLIDVKDYFSFVAVRKVNAAATLTLIRDEKIKNKKVKIEIAK